MNHTKEIIAESIEYLIQHYPEAPSLTFLAQRAGYEATYFQKVFKRHVGLSPQKMVHYMRMRHVGTLLAEKAGLLEAAYDSGLSGTGRLHDLCISCVGLTPGALKQRGAGVLIRFGYFPSPFGWMLLGASARGICYLGFGADGGNSAAPFSEMRAYFPMAEFCEDAGALRDTAKRISAIWSGQKGTGDEDTLLLDVYGTNMQIQVWQALLRISPGKTKSYQDIAREIGKPRAARAVGNAVGANPVSLLIPCHRVIRQTGIIDNYHWGSSRKKLILALE